MWHINTTYFIWSKKKIKLEPVIIWKLVTCQRITSKKYLTSTGRHLSPWYAQVILVGGYPLLTAVTTLKSNMYALSAVLPKLKSWTKALGHSGAFLCLSGAFSNSHRSNFTPPLTPQTMSDMCIQNFFWASTLHRMGGGRTARKFQKACTVLRGNRQMKEKYKDRSTVPRTFFQDCSLKVCEH